MLYYANYTLFGVQAFVHFIYSASGWKGSHSKGTRAGSDLKR